MRVSAAENPIPVWERVTLTVQEAVDYTGIGRDKLYELTDRDDCEFVLWVGSRRLLKRKSSKSISKRLFHFNLCWREKRMQETKIKKEVPLWEKMNLTLDEAAKLTGVGVNRLREISDREDCDFVLWVGNKRLLKRKKLEEYLDQQKCV